MWRNMIRASLSMYSAHVAFVVRHVVTLVIAWQLPSISGVAELSAT